MALTATIRRFDIDLSDMDRGVYEQLELRAAQHPSESEAYLVTRVLAMALEHCDGLTFGRGISTPDEPGLSAPNTMGGYEIWIEIGQPSGDKLHKITKRADRVCIYTHKNPEPIVADLASGSIHRGDEIVLVSFAPDFIDALTEVLTRNNKWGVLRTDGILYVSVGDETLETTPTLHQGQPTTSWS